MLKTLIFGCSLFCLAIAADDLSILQGDAQRRYASKRNEIAGNFMYEGAKRNPGKIFSTSVTPLSEAMAALALCAEGDTYYTLLDFLNLRSKDEIRRFFPVLNRETFVPNLVGSPLLTLNVYTDESNQFCPEFSYEFNKTFGGTTRVVDYDDPEEAAEEINNEVKSEGSGGFQDLITSDMIKEGPGLNFISTFEITVLYDKKFRFTTETTIKFKSGNKVTTIPAMAGQGILKYANNRYLDAKVVELEGGSDYSYVIIYPNKEDGLMSVLSKLRSRTLFEEILEELTEACGKVSITMRDFIGNADLGKSARDSNYLNGFFEEGGLELDGVTERCSNTYISSVLHQIRLKPGPLSKKGYKDNKCSEYEVQLETNRPHLYIVTYTTETSPYRTPIVAVVVDITS